MSCKTMPLISKAHTLVHLLILIPVLLSACMHANVRLKTEMERVKKSRLIAVTKARSQTVINTSTSLGFYCIIFYDIIVCLKVVTLRG